MLKIAALAAAMAFTATPLLAADIGGFYKVEGTNFDGSSYGGRAHITLTSKNTCRIAWNTGSTSEGICMRNDNAFAAGYVMGNAVGLVIYQVMGDGTLEGIWTIADKTGIGTERLVPIK